MKRKKRKKRIKYIPSETSNRLTDISLKYFNEIKKDIFTPINPFFRKKEVNRNASKKQKTRKIHASRGAQQSVCEKSRNPAIRSKKISNA